LFLTESLNTAELGGAVLLAGILIMAVGTMLIARTRAVSLLAGG
jgi:hypothetical protein